MPGYPLSMRIYDRVVTLLTWPLHVRQLRREGFVRVGWMTWEYRGGSGASREGALSHDEVTEMNFYAVTVPPETAQLLERLGVRRYKDDSFFMFDEDGAERLRRLPESTDGRMEDTGYGDVLVIGGDHHRVSHLF
jgi:hypothetical protein